MLKNGVSFFFGGTNFFKGMASVPDIGATLYSANDWDVVSVDYAAMLHDFAAVGSDLRMAMADYE